MSYIKRIAALTLYLSISFALDVEEKERVEARREEYIRTCSSLLSLETERAVLEQLIQGIIPWHPYINDEMHASSYLALIRDVGWLTAFNGDGAPCKIIPERLSRLPELTIISFRQSQLVTLTLSTLSSLINLTHVSFKGSSNLCHVEINGQVYLNNTDNKPIIENALVKLVRSLSHLESFNLSGTKLSNFQERVDLTIAIEKEKRLRGIITRS